MSYQVNTTGKFEKALKKCIKRGLNIQHFKNVLDELTTYGKVSEKYRPHKLSGKFHNAWECHIEPDWLLIWEQNDTELILLLIDTGTHADLF